MLRTETHSYKIMGFCMVKNISILLSLTDPNIPAQCIQGCRLSQMSGLQNLKYLCLWERNKLWLHVSLGFRFSVMILSFLFNIILVLFVYYDVFGTLAVPFDVQLWWQIILTINTSSTGFDYKYFRTKFFSVLNVIIISA